MSQIAVVGGATPRFLADGGLTAEAVRSLVDSIPDRSRREYETGAADAGFKRMLNSILLAAGCGFLCVEWLARRLARLA